MKKYKWDDSKIAQWHKKTFDCDYNSQLLKLCEEVRESYVEKGKNKQRWIEELADVSIAAAALDLRFKRHLGALVNDYIRFLPEADEIMTARDAKMEINKNRSWEFWDGVYRHTEA